MLASIAMVGQILEAVMLTCFGCSWPISIRKSLRTKYVRGKSPGFMTLVFIGYVAGTASKFFKASAAGETLPWVTGLYAINALLVATDLVLYMRYRHNLEPATEAVAHDMADIIDHDEHARTED